MSTASAAELERQLVLAKEAGDETAVQFLKFEVRAARQRERAAGESSGERTFIRISEEQ